MAMLKRISLQGYKSIRDRAELKLERLNVLIGANGSGKSNLLSFFDLLNAAMRGELQIFVGQSGAAHSLLHLGPKQTAEVHAELEFDGEADTSIYSTRLIFAAPDNLIMGAETFRAVPKPGSKEKFSELVAHGANESAVVQPGMRDNERLKQFAKMISGLRVYHFDDTSLLARVRGHWRAADHRLLYARGENLAPVLHTLREDYPDAYFRILETIRLIAPCFGDFVLQPPPNSPDLVMLNWRARGQDYEFGPHQLSDGTLRFMALATLLLLPAGMLPEVIIIDEPELGLHPYAIKILASLLADAAERAQVIVATQSPGLVDQVRPEDIVVANMEEGATTLQRLEPARLADWLADYSLSAMWESNLFGGQP